MTPHNPEQGPECNRCRSKPSVLHILFLSWQELVFMCPFPIFYHPCLEKFTLQSSHWHLFVCGKDLLLKDRCLSNSNFFERFPLRLDHNRSGEETAFFKAQIHCVPPENTWRCIFLQGFHSTKWERTETLDQCTTACYWGPILAGFSS